MAALSTIASIAAITASAVSVGSTLLSKGPQAPPGPSTLLTQGEPERVSERETATAATLRKRKAPAVPGKPDAAKAGRAGTLLTGPKGLSETTLQRKSTLLGGGY